MGIFYYKLFDLLNRKGMKKGDLMSEAQISNATMAKLSKNMNVEVAVIARICRALNCQPGELMEYITEESTEE